MDTQAREHIERLTAKVEEQQAIIDALVARTAQQDEALMNLTTIVGAIGEATRETFNVVERRETDLLLRVTRLEQGR